MMTDVYTGTRFLEDPRLAFSKEFLLTSGDGAYCSSTIGGCNTRKYHGLLVAPQPLIDDSDHLLLSAIDEHVIYQQASYHLGTHKYPDSIYPTGYRYIEEFTGNPIPKWRFKLCGCVLEKEILMPEGEQAVMIRYTLAEAEEKVTLDLQPFLAFRNVHDLQKANLLVNKKVETLSNGICMKLYEAYTHLVIQTSQKAEFVTAPDWYYQVEYPREQSRGYAYSEDLYVPGHFSLTMKKGDKVIVWAGVNETIAKSLGTRFTVALKKKPGLKTEKDCLVQAARQFVLEQGDELRIKAGYHWFGCWGRDTFISLPGLLLATGNTKQFAAVMNTSVKDLKNGLFPNVGVGKRAVYNSADASLWFIWAVQQYAGFINSPAKAWKEYGKYCADVLAHYRQGTLNNIKMDADGLIYAGREGMALTWMDAVVNGEPVTPRTGKPVEINALWYNAVCFSVDAAKACGDLSFAEQWSAYPEKIRESFTATFWDEDKKYLADCVNNDYKDWSVRPNQVFAVSLPYSPLAAAMRKPVIDLIKEELLTPKGLRTLSPRDGNYKGACEGDQQTRDGAYHQGTIWPWLWGHFSEAYLKECGSRSLREVHEICYDFSAMLQDECLYTIPEIYNGDAPFRPAGAVAQAWSVAELLRMNMLLEDISGKAVLYERGLA